MSPLVVMHIPRWYVAVLPHDGTEREPESIEHTYRGDMSQPCRMMALSANQKLFSTTYRGDMSHPCRMMALSANQKLFNTTYRGEMSQPCRMMALSANQKLLSIVKSLAKLGPLTLSSICHSYGLKRLTKNSPMLTPM